MAVAGTTSREGQVRESSLAQPRVSLPSLGGNIKDLLWKRLERVKLLAATKRHIGTQTAGSAPKPWRWLLADTVLEGRGHLGGT